MTKEIKTDDKTLVHILGYITDGSIWLDELKKLTDSARDAIKTKDEEMAGQYVKEYNILKHLAKAVCDKYERGIEEKGNWETIKVLVDMPDMVARLDICPECGEKMRVGGMGMTHYYYCPKCEEAKKNG